MTRFWSFVLLLLFYAIGLLLFTRGFLLKRTVLSLNSSCSLDFETVPPAGSWHRGGAMPKENLGSPEDVHSQGCWMAPRYKKAVILLIDALRFDFIAATLSQSDELYANRLTVVTKAITEEPQNSRLYRFVADAPTTTLQRLKGLTTGSLPTFVDAGANFASSEITEDNVIDQLLKMIPNMTFIGDDTWVSLFPHRFTRSFPYPSFNTKDLHTVDNGVITRIIGEIEREEAGLVIGHLLGVDHCGHTYGPNSTAMAEKLDQMNQLIGSVMSSISDDTLLLVMGDHGMTRSGDHGGDSLDEINSALFVYSKSQLTAAPPLSKGLYETISQIDLVPTLSLLLGAPIPFSNLGTVITDMFDTASRITSEASFSDAHQRELKEDEAITSLNYVVQALRLNALQVSRYVDAYANSSTDLSLPALDSLRQLLSTANNDLNNMNLEGLTTEITDLRRVHDLYKLYLSGVRDLCQSVWAQFDLTAMTAGLVLSISTLVIHVAILSSSVDDSRRGGDILMSIAQTLCLVSHRDPTLGEQNSKCSKRCRVVFRVGAVVVLWIGGVAVALISSFSVVFSVALATLAIIYFLSFCISVRRLYRWIGHASERPLLDDRFSLMLWLMYILSISSNSYVVWEQYVGGFLLVSLVIGVGVKSFYSTTIGQLASVLTTKHADKKESVAPGRSKSGPGYSLAVYVGIFGACIRASFHFLACREEHGPTCRSSFSVLPLTSLSQELLFIRVSMAVFSIGVIVFLVQRWLSHHARWLDPPRGVAAGTVKDSATTADP